MRVHWAPVSWLFLAAYACSGLGGLVYEVAWTRLLTLLLGHTTAAASAVVGAFLLGLALGAAIAGRLAGRLTRAGAFAAYAIIEVAVALCAVALPWQLAALTPLLAWAYQDGTSGALFPLVRAAACALLILVPALGLGATFPLAVRGLAADAPGPARRTARLYALNTAGAAAGALLAGFVLIPSLGVRGTTLVGVAASLLSAAAAVVVARRPPAIPEAGTSPQLARGRIRARRSAAAPAAASPDAGANPPASAPWLAAAVLGVSGFSALVHEIAWTRILAMVLGPTTYAFAAALAAVITGTALGSWGGTWILGRTGRPAGWLAGLFAAGALVTTATASLAGGPLPYFVAERIRDTPDAAAAWAAWSGWITAGLVVPTAACLGAAFTVGLGVAGASAATAAARFSAVYAANTIGAVSGSAAAGFLLIPWLGLQGTLRVAGMSLILAALAVLAWGTVPRRARRGGFGAAAVAALVLIVSPAWDRALLASGGYLYAPFVPPDLDLGPMLRAGTLQYYAEGASATIAVKRLTGTTTLTVDGKTDASNRGDMLTQKLAAHLPLLLHDDPRDVAVIGLGSGVTVGAALTHPVTRVDVLELSPEVVAASRHFATENRRALDDPRTRLIVGDGRSHLLLARRTYDVIVSEPSNPWIAGVATLFTREFFTAAKARLAPGGVLCQWANAYNIAAADLRAIVATFLAVFPGGSAWLVGEHDVLLVGGLDAHGAADAGLSLRLDAIAAHWIRPGVAEDLDSVGATAPLTVQSLFVAGPAELGRYAGGAPVFTDDRLTLEFTAPREIHRRSGAENGRTLRALFGDDGRPPMLTALRAAAGAAGWRERGRMFARSDVHGRAYDDFQRALTLDPADTTALAGLVRAASLLDREAETLEWLRAATAARGESLAETIARSRLQAAAGATAGALAAAREAVTRAPGNADALEQLAAVQADAGDPDGLEAAVAELRRLPPTAATEYYAAAARLLRDDPRGALDHAERAIALDPAYAAVYDLAGAALTRLDQPDRARAMFERSLAFDAHDSAAYTNLGLLDLAAGRHAAARNWFAEALWLDPASATAREGLARSR
jgi:spermidine synthase